MYAQIGPIHLQLYSLGRINSPYEGVGLAFLCNVGGIVDGRDGRGGRRLLHHWCFVLLRRRALRLSTPAPPRQGHHSEDRVQREEGDRVPASPPSAWAAKRRTWTPRAQADLVRTGWDVCGNSGLDAVGRCAFFK